MSQGVIIFFGGQVKIYRITSVQEKKE